MDLRASLRRVLPDVPSDVLDALLSRTRPEVVEAGGIVFREGEDGTDAVVLETGRLLVLTSDGEGRVVPLAALEDPGSLVGEQALLDSRGRRNATVLAAERTTLHRIPGALFRASLAGSPEGVRQLEEIGATQARSKLDALSGLLGPRSGWSGEALRERIRLAAGAVLFEAGTEPSEAFAVVSGRIAVRDPETGRIVYEVGPGELVGNRSILEQRQRRRSAVATRDSELLRIPAARVADLAAQSIALGGSSDAAWGIHDLSGFGTCFRYSAFVDHQPCLTADYTLEDGRRVVVRHFPESALVAASAGSPGVDERAIRTPGGGASLRISATDRTLVGVSARTDWPPLGEALRSLLLGERVEPWQEDGLESHGVFLAGTQGSTGSTRGIVCGCANLSASALERLRAEGIGGLEELGRRTGAGTVCGGCKGRLGSLLSRGTLLLCSLEGRILSDEIREFSLTPIRGSLPPCRPGEHVLVEGMIDGGWEGRPYTVTMATPESYRIAVKREPEGMFSSWLFEADAGELVRITPPAGSITPSAENPCPLVYVVGGIGVTPAIAGCRSLAGRRSLHVVYSFREPGEAAYLEELRAMDRAGLLTLVEVATAMEGRLAPERAERLLAGLGEAEVVVCGPDAFNRSVAERLRGAGEVTLHIESFSDESFRDLLAVQSAPGSWRVPGFRARHPSGAEPVEEGSSLGVLEEARRFLRAMDAEIGSTAADERIAAMEREVGERGTWTQTTGELSHAARVAWRNAVRCVGRMYWPGLEVRDLRHVDHPDDIASALVDHLRSAWNGGELKPIISVFAPEEPRTPSPRIWNPQLIRYAGYAPLRGRRRGDPANAALTRRIEALGWKGPGGDFDVLPLVIDVPGFGPRVYELPPEATPEVRIRHPEHPWLDELELRWYAVPAVSEMALDAGGILYRLAPFNGWYMGTEIAARNFTDADRYDLLPEIGRRMGLDQSSDRTLWRDAAMVMLNQAVLHSYDRAGVKMADHHAATREFLQFCRAEQEAGREVYGEWSWLVPPISGSATPLYLETFELRSLKPAFVVQPPPETPASE